MLHTRSAIAMLIAAALLSLQACGGGGDERSAGTGQEAPLDEDEAPGAGDPGDGVTPPDGGSASSASYDCGLPGYRAEVLQRLNAARAAGASCGANGSFPAAGAVAWNDALTAAAQGHAADMAAKNYFSHVSQDGRTFTQRLEAAGYAWSAAGENIAAGQRSVQAVVDGWMASDGHCANIMGASFQDVGMACVQAQAGASAYGMYWTLNLARPR